METSKYDEPDFFEKYSQMDRSVKGLQGAGEWHVLKTMLPDLSGRRVLDLGCGFGWHCAYAVRQGAVRVLGVDLSEKMLSEAKKRNSHPAITYQKASIEAFQCEPESFDAVISSLALHYVEDFFGVCQKVYDALRPGGSFVFSVEHPVFTAYGSQDWYRDGEGRPVHWPVDRYFSEGERIACFLGEEVAKQHRTLTTYLGSLLSAGFRISAVVEPTPDPALLDTVPGMRDELRRPMMLLVSAQKPS